MKNVLAAAVALALMAIFVSAAQAINIEEATIQNGQVFIAGNQAPRRAAILQEGVALGISSNPGGVFKFNTTNLPPDCVGRLQIGTAERDVVINNCTPANITVIEAGVPKTGQTTSYDPNTPQWDDGALQKGVAWPSPRFTDNGNGTISDNLTGLIWLKDANCFGGQLWVDALALAKGLAAPQCGLSDGSVAGDWRMPNVRELHSLVDFEQINPCLPSGHPFTNFAAWYYWSSTTLKIENFVHAVGVWFGYGAAFNVPKWSTYPYVIPVRGGS